MGDEGRLQNGNVSCKTNFVLLLNFHFLFYILRQNLSPKETDRHWKPSNRLRSIDGGRHDA